MYFSHSLLHGRLQWMMFLRVVVATFLLGATVLLQLREPRSFFTPPVIGLYALIAAAYLLTFLYVFLLKKSGNLQLQAYVQIVADLLMETFLVYLTGSEESVFSSIYNLSIIAGSILLYRQGGLAAASLSGLLYGGLLNLRYFGMLSPLAWGYSRSVEVVGGEIYHTILVNISAFFLVAFLSSYLAEQARTSQHELEVTQSDLSKLTAIHEDILQCLHSGLLTSDLYGRITFANQAASEITGLPLDDILHRSLPSLFPYLPNELLQGSPGASGPSEARRKTMDYFMPDGRRIHLGFSLAPFRSADGAILGTITHFQDLTQTIAMEEHLRRVDRLATIGEMAARIAHEIRNPLASLSGSIQILRNELNLDGPNSRLMEIVTREAHRLNALLTDFRLFARPEQLNIRQVDLARALHETLELFMEQAREEAPVELIPQIAPDLIVEADAKKLRQMFWNLLNNALEAMPQGGRLKVGARWASPTAGDSQGDALRWVMLEVEDSGVGIPPEIRDHVFDPFFTTKDRGTGLGLSMVHRSLEDIGGRIELQSEIGKGTRFALWIPSHPVNDSITGPPTARTGGGDGDLS
jgi:two-component system, NtrC family, sensor histidine kinase PilS